MSIRPASTEKYNEIKNRINSLGLHTICVEGHCPNITECWSGGTATFMVLGDKCTRGCRFCAVSKSAKGINVDKEEPEKLGQLVREWGLSYIVVTSVCRDDLEDQGAGHFAKCVAEIKKASPNTTIEVLIPDFRNDPNCIRKIIDAKPEVIGHNLETVERLTPYARDRRASYRQSLEVLSSIKKADPSRYTKTAIMLGLGEGDEEVIRTLTDARLAKIDFMAIGQYLKPSPAHAEVKEYVRPEKFNYFKEKALEMGFLYVASGPFVRSSYKAGEFFIKRIVSKALV